MSGGLVLAAAITVSVTGCDHAIGGHAVAVDAYLSHQGVERYIASKLGDPKVRCNHGHDLPLVIAGQTMICTGVRTYKVIVANAKDGRYTVS